MKVLKKIKKNIKIKKTELLKKKKKKKLIVNLLLI